MGSYPTTAHFAKCYQSWLWEIHRWSTPRDTWTSKQLYLL